MRDFVITTDGNSDFTPAYAAAHDLRIIPLSFAIAEEQYDEGRTMPPHDFYDLMRRGEMPTTNAILPEQVKQIFTEELEAGRDILHIAFSSALSGSYNVAAMVGGQLSESYPEAKIVVIDSLSASLGQGLLIYLADRMRRNGASITETAQWVEDHKRNICHQFTVDSLFHLFRGGRVSRTAAIVGTLAQIKPVLHVDDEGRLIAIGKVRGRKKSLNALVDNMEKCLGSYAGKNEIVFISHGDCPEDAQYVADKVKERFGIEAFFVDYVNPTIGAHSGPGTVALFHLGDRR